MVKLSLLLGLITLSVQDIQALEISTNLLLRYENETNQINLIPRKRVRAIASLGVTHKFDDIWEFTGQLRTGLKNKQNVPAITLLQITDQSSGDKDVYLSRAFTKVNLNGVTFIAGKIPWKSQQVTDLFWDRHLNPIGINLDYEMTNGDRLTFATFKPLDGARNTVGHMSVFQYQTKISTRIGLFTLSPWLVDYRGQSGAEFATKDTQFDNRFMRFSGSLKFASFQIGTDLGWSTKQVPDEFSKLFSKQKMSYALAVKQGGLKHVGSFLTELKYLHVERFSVVTEFAQNASSRFATSNYKGWDLRIRYRFTEQLWVGTRLSRTKRLIGSPEQSVRFRVETKYSF